MAKFNNFDINSLEQLSIVIGEHLTGSQLTNFFAQVNYDKCSTITKRIRVFNFFTYIQNNYHCSNKIIEFIQNIVNPVNYINNQSEYLYFLESLNKILAFSGLSINEKGQFLSITKVETIDEATKKANNLRKLLFDRNIHPDILRFCKSELISENYFHAVFEATKSVADKIRLISGLKLDGNQLIYTTFDKNRPLIAINTLQTPSELNEYNGFKNLLVGIFGMFRNTLAHEPKINWEISEQDAIDLLTTLSFIHRKLDKAVKIPY